MKFLSEEEFEEAFTTIPAPDGSEVWQTVEDIQAAHAGVTADRVWTWIDGDEGGTYLIAGVHWVNAYGFSLTEQPHDFDIEVEFESAEEQEERYKTDG